MQLRKSEIIVLLITVLSLVISLYVYQQLPAKIAAQWNYKGEVDGYMPKAWGLFLMPLVLFFLFLLFLILPRVDPMKANVLKFRKYFDGFIIVLFLFMVAIHLQIILWNFGIEIKPDILFPIGFGTLFFYLGILMQKSKRNWFIGFKTPWTLSSDLVWDKTHKLGGKLLKVCGIISIIGIKTKIYAIFFVLVPIIITLIYLTIYSYLEYKKETK